MSSALAAAPSFDPLIAEARRRARRRRLGVLAMVVVSGAVWLATRGAGGPAPPALPRLELRSEPGMGVACPSAPNSIACDRVAIAVMLLRPAKEVTVTVGGRTAVLHHYARCDWPGYRRFCATSFTGYLQPAGLIGGALKVIPDGGRLHWTGVHPKTAVMTIRATGYAPVRRRVELAAGWG